MDPLNIVLVVFTAVQALVAVVAVQSDSRAKAAADTSEADRLRREDRANRLEANQRLLALHEAITRPEILELRAGVPLARHELLARKAVIDRALLLSPLLDQKGATDEALRKFAADELDSAKIAIQDRPEFQDTIERAEEKLGTDRSRYTWGSSEKLSKILTLQLVARTLAKTQHLVTIDAFTTSFEHHLREALPPQILARMDKSKLLTPANSDSTTQQWEDKLDALFLDSAGALTFGGESYVLDWWVGFRNEKSVGTAVHKPIIEHFLALRDSEYPIQRA